MEENADLDIRIFLDNSLTNYLHQLSPQSAIDELTKNALPDPDNHREKEIATEEIAAARKNSSGK